AGMVVKSRSEQWSARLRPAIGIVANVSMILAVLLLIGLNVEAMLGTFGGGDGRAVRLADASDWLRARRSGAGHAVGSRPRHRAAERRGSALDRNGEL